MATLTKRFVRLCILLYKSFCPTRNLPWSLTSCHYNHQLQWWDCVDTRSQMASSLLHLVKDDLKQDNWGTYHPLLSVNWSTLETHSAAETKKRSTIGISIWVSWSWLSAASTWAIMSDSVASTKLRITDKTREMRSTELQLNNTDREDNFRLR